VRRFCAAFEERRNLIADRIAQIDGLTLDPPGGAFYGLICCADLIGAETEDGDTLRDDAEVTAYILKDAGIAAVPGSAYELSPFFRISTAASMDVLGQAMDRIATSVAKLKRKT
jgi:aspartate aminotransferase